MRLIDAENLWKAITTRIEECCDLADLSEIIETQPTIDAVPVIRCKDCVHFKQSKVLGNTCALTDNHVTKKDYCSKAERKEE